jgi:ankyrin repeat protein
MDIAGKELFLLCQEANIHAASSHLQLRRATTTPRHTSSHQNYCTDKLGVNDHGTSLHRLLASHCRPSVVAEFLQQARAHEAADVSRRKGHQERRREEIDGGAAVERSPPISSEESAFDGLPNPPPSIRAQNVKGATALHVAAFRNSAHVGTIIDLLLDWDRSQADGDSLASIPMNCGSYPLHVLTGQNTTIQQHALESLLLADPTVALKEDVNGDNPLSLLWKNTLRFRWAINVMEGSTYIDYANEDDHCSWITIIPPEKFIRFSRLMIHAALGKPISSSIENGITFHELCSIPRCPPMLFRLAQFPRYHALLGIFGDVHTLDDQGMLPLHHAVQQRPATYRFVPDYLKPQYRKTLVRLLLEEYPESAMATDGKGRLPLHYALESGCVNERDLLKLVELHPESLRVQDPVSGLYPFMLVASQTNQRIEQTTTSYSIPSYVRAFGSGAIPGPLKDTATAMERSDVLLSESEDGWKEENIRISFLLLLLCPEAVQFQDVCPCH